MRIISVILLLSGFLIFTPTHAVSAVFFSENFDVGPSPYGFEGEHDFKCTTYPDWASCSPNEWATEHLPTGGWNGTGGARLIFRRSQDQNELGWYNWSNFKAWLQGDFFYVRFRIRFDDNMRWDGTGSQQNKMFIWGSGTYNGWNHRVMLHQEGDHQTSPCCQMAPEYSNSNYGLFSLKRNIQEFCTSPVPVTYGRWYHVQFYVKSGTTADSTDAQFKVWINNNHIGLPTSSKIGGFNLAVEGIWNRGFTFGGYWTNNNPNRDVSWVVDDFQIGDTFDPEWYPAPLPPPNIPTNLRLLD